jgi:hypothetical protein
VDFAHHLFFCFCGVFSCFDEFAEYQSIFAELGGDELVDSSGRLCGPAVRVEGLGNKTVLGDEVGDHIPLSAITNRLLQ